MLKNKRFRSTWASSGMALLVNLGLYINAYGQLLGDAVWKKKKMKWMYVFI